MEVLWLPNNQVSTCKYFETLAGLKEIKISLNPLVDFQSLTELKKLESIEAFRCQLTPNSIQQFNSVSLQNLRLDYNNIGEFRWLENYPNLKRLCLDGNGISALEIDTVHHSLSVLELRENKLIDLSPLGKCVELGQLYLGNNALSNIDTLGKLEKLWALSLTNNRLSDTKGLSQLTKLSNLDLSSNQLRSVKGLKSLTELTRLILTDNELNSLEGLQYLKKLRFLELKGNPLTRSEIIRLQGQLPNCYISHDFE